MRLVYTLLLPLAMSGCSSTGIVSTGPDTYMTARNGGRPSGLGAQISAQLYREAHTLLKGFGVNMVGRGQILNRKAKRFSEYLEGLRVKKAPR